MTEDKQAETVVNEDDLKKINGGMDWSKFRLSRNVEDRRPGAPSLREQRRQVDRENRRRGYR